MLYLYNSTFTVGILLYSSVSVVRERGRTARAHLQQSCIARSAPVLKFVTVGCWWNISILWQICVCCQLLNRFNAFRVLLFRRNSLQLFSHRWVIVSNARFANFSQNLQCFALARCNTLQRQCTDPQTLAILVYSVITRALGRCRALARESTTPSHHKSVTFRLTGSVLFVVLR